MEGMEMGTGVLSTGDKLLGVMKEDEIGILKKGIEENGFFE